MSNLIADFFSLAGSVLDQIPGLGWTGSFTVPIFLVIMFGVALAVAKILTMGARKKKYGPLFIVFALACVILFFYWAGDNLSFNFPITAVQIKELFSRALTVPPTGTVIESITDFYSTKTTIITKPFPAGILLGSVGYIWNKSKKDQWSEVESRNFYICVAIILMMVGYLAVRSHILWSLSSEQMLLIKSW